jgi:hypothetical protein
MLLVVNQLGQGRRRMGLGSRSAVPYRLGRGRRIWERGKPIALRSVRKPHPCPQQT